MTTRWPLGHRLALPELRHRNAPKGERTRLRKAYERDVANELRLELQGRRAGQGFRVEATGMVGR